MGSDTVITVAPTPKTLASRLSKRGPHRVLRGDLSLAGQPGVVFTPASGFSMPAVAFAHGWMTGVDRYQETLTHLASWGLVVAAPDTQRSPVPSHVALASDLRTAIDICVGVRTGPGEDQRRPHKDRLRRSRDGCRRRGARRRAHGPAAAVAALFPAPTAPPAERSAAKIAAPGLIVAGADDLESMNCNAKSLATAWDGQAILRTVDGASAGGLAEGQAPVRRAGSRRFRTQDAEDDPRPADRLPALPPARRDGVRAVRAARRAAPRHPRGGPDRRAGSHQPALPPVGLDPVRLGFGSPGAAAASVRSRSRDRRRAGALVPPTDRSAQ